MDEVDDAARRRRRTNAGHHGDLLARIDKADYSTLIAAVRPAFSYARYGM